MFVKVKPFVFKYIFQTHHSQCNVELKLSFKLFKPVSIKILLRDTMRCHHSFHLIEYANPSSKVQAYLADRRL